MTWQDSEDLNSISFTAKESSTGIPEHCMRHDIGELVFLFSSWNSRYVQTCTFSAPATRSLVDLPWSCFRWGRQKTLVTVRKICLANCDVIDNLNHPLGKGDQVNMKQLQIQCPFLEHPLSVLHCAEHLQAGNHLPFCLLGFL